MRIVVLMLLAAMAGGPVAIDANPRKFFSGSSVRVRCRVPPAAENRTLTWGIDGYRSSTEDVDHVTYETVVPHVPCGAGAAFCRLTRAGKPDVVVTLELEVIACEPPTSLGGPDDFEGSATR